MEGRDCSGFKLAKRTEILENQVKEFEKANATSVQPTVDAINGLLSAFGFNSFKIQVASDGITFPNLPRANEMTASAFHLVKLKNVYYLSFFYSLIKGAAVRIRSFNQPNSSV